VIAFPVVLCRVSPDPAGKSLHGVNADEGPECVIYAQRCHGAGFKLIANFLIFPGFWFPGAIFSRSPLLFQDLPVHLP